MKKYIIAAAVLLGSSSAAFAAAPDQVASLAMSCCDLVLACCEAAMDCCPLGTSQDIRAGVWSLTGRPLFCDLFAARGSLMLTSTGPGSR